MSFLKPSSIQTSPIRRQVRPATRTLADGVARFSLRNSISSSASSTPALPAWGSGADPAGCMGPPRSKTRGIVADSGTGEGAVTGAGLLGAGELLTLIAYAARAEG